MNLSKITDSSAKTELIGLTREELSKVFIALDESPQKASMRAKQLWHWIYYQGVCDFSVMSTMSPSLRDKLEKTCSISRPNISSEKNSSDGTRKWLMQLSDHSEVECVYIPETNRGAVCISSQVGCTLTCKFCHTGTQKLVRNLDCSEIVGQFMAARDSYKEWPSPKTNRKLSNIVMMGMGEPLFNYENIYLALKVMMDSEGIALSRRRITLSTAGVVPMMHRCGNELGVGLAVSLHAVNNELRDELVPLNKKYPIEDLLDACRKYPGASNARRITFEYVMLDGVNDSLSDARELLRLIKGIPAKINLIPFNAWPGSPFKCSSQRAIKKFSNILNDGGYSAPIRTPRGRDILAACGQLKSESIKIRKNQQKSLLI
tara:strand:+ start:40163 stop:41287 length:1125 start_codon:yes stop_codon:yes gene_type:complete